MFVRGKGKDEYLTGEIVTLKTGDPNLKLWKSENNMVMSWLINSMTNEIGENFLLCSTADEIWAATKSLYSSKDNTSETFELESTLQDLQQGELSVTQFFNILTRYWQQLDVFEDLQWACTEDAKKFREIVEKKRIFKFLMGLNQNLDEVRGRILGSKPIPSIKEVFSEVRREESRKKVMLGDSSVSSNMESQSALAAQGIQYSSNDNRSKKGRPWCDHCRKPGHTRETCWKIHGKPADWKPFRSSLDRANRGNHATTEEGSHATPGFNKEQLDAIQQMLSQMLSQNNPKVGSLAHTEFGLGEDDWQC